MSLESERECIEIDDEFDQAVALSLEMEEISKLDMYSRDEELAKSIHANDQKLSNSTLHMALEEREGHAEDRAVDWECSVCTSNNPGASTACNVCDYSLFSPAIVGDKIEEFWDEKEIEAQRAASTWTCTTCETVNDINNEPCPQCLEPKIRVRENQSWQCPKCTFDNTFCDRLCFMCGHEVPGTVILDTGGCPSTCGIPGCVRAPSHYGFCSKAHFDMATEKRIIPPSERGVEVVFVGDTGDYTAHLLLKSHPKHASVKDQFLTSWQKMDFGLPRVER